MDEAEIMKAGVMDDKNGEPSATHALTEDPETVEPKKRSMRVTLGLRWRIYQKKHKRETVPITLSLLIIAAYIFFGALLFSQWEEGWDYRIGSYFCFITLSTIGFGDYVPGTSVDSWAAQEKLILCALYLVFGLALIAMCFDLMQDEVRHIVTKLGKRLGLLDRNK